MSVDELGRRATDELRAAAARSDEIVALEAVLGSRPTRWTGARLVAVCAAAALVVAGAAVVRAQLNPSASLSPAGQLAGAVVGERMSLPVRLTVPVQWTAATNQAYVTLLPTDGSDRSITVTPADKAFDPPLYATLTRPADFMVWTLSHPALEASNRTGGAWGDGYVSAQMDLTLSDPPAQHLRVAPPGTLPLVPLSPEGAAITISENDQTFRWAIVTTHDGDLLVAARSSAPRDTFLWDGFNTLVTSLRVVPSGEATGG
ncbi:MAG: hypothetical protein OEV62_00345 [Actinomycetota bacterium]|nr:hypothetical protein [Actinomycetota bacterium]MDH4352451.1 hypothetical protein [Actinomycetota bacterium]